MKLLLIFFLTVDYILAKPAINNNETGVTLTHSVTPRTRETDKKASSYNSYEDNATEILKLLKLEHQNVKKEDKTNIAMILRKHLKPSKYNEFSGTKESFTELSDQGSGLARNFQEVKDVKQTMFLKKKEQRRNQKVNKILKEIRTLIAKRGYKSELHVDRILDIIQINLPVLFLTNGTCRDIYHNDDLITAVNDAHRDFLINSKYFCGDESANIFAEIYHWKKYRTARKFRQTKFSVELSSLGSDVANLEEQPSDQNTYRYQGNPRTEYVTISNGNTDQLTTEDTLDKKRIEEELLHFDEKYQDKHLNEQRNNNKKVFVIKEMHQQAVRNLDAFDFFCGDTATHMYLDAIENYLNFFWEKLNCKPHLKRKRKTSVESLAKMIRDEFINGKGIDLTAMMTQKYKKKAKKKTDAFLRQLNKDGIVFSREDLKKRPYKNDTYNSKLQQSTLKSSKKLNHVTKTEPCSSADADGILMVELTYAIKLPLIIITNLTKFLIKCVVFFDYNKNIENIYYTDALSNYIQILLARNIVKKQGDVSKVLYKMYISKGFDTSTSTLLNLYDEFHNLNKNPEEASSLYDRSYENDDKPTDKSDNKANENGQIIKKTIKDCNYFDKKLYLNKIPDEINTTENPNHIIVKEEIGPYNTIQPVKFAFAKTIQYDSDTIKNIADTEDTESESSENTRHRRSAPWTDPEGQISPLNSYKHDYRKSMKRLKDWAAVLHLRLKNKNSYQSKRLRHMLSWQNKEFLF